MNSEPRRCVPSAAGHRHPATMLVLCLFTAGELFLNVWYVEPRRGLEYAFGYTTARAEHGFPFTWLDRELTHRRFGASESEGLSHLEQKLRIALPLEFATGGGSLHVWAFFLDLAIGVYLFFSLRSLGDRFFGFRPRSAFRFGLGTALVGMTAAAIVFAMPSEFVMQVGSILVFVLAVFLAVASPIVREFDAERAVFQEQLRRRRLERASEEQALLERTPRDQDPAEQAPQEIELTDVGSSEQ